ncbi:MAG: hypothetical protein V8T36_02310 [Ruthenibacterium lactatiformans]
MCAGATVNVVPGYEYKSKHTLFGLPLVHINCGYGLRRAKGVIAIGNIATGIVALGGFGVGVVSFCGIGVGLLSLGGLALGGFAVGGVAVGLVAAGGCAIGMYAMGGAAVASRWPWAAQLRRLSLWGRMQMRAWLSPKRRRCRMWRRI